MKTTIKEVFENDNWEITRIYQGSKKLRVDAKTKNRVADEENFFSKWVSYGYVDKLSRENFGKGVNKFAKNKYY